MVGKACKFVERRKPNAKYQRKGYAKNCDKKGEILGNSPQKFEGHSEAHQKQEPKPMAETLAPRIFLLPAKRDANKIDKMTNAGPKGGLEC